MKSLVKYLMLSIKTVVVTIVVLFAYCALSMLVGELGVFITEDPVQWFIDSIYVFWYLVGALFIVVIWCSLEDWIKK